MKYAGYEDLIQIRQVCQIWRSEARGYLEKKSKITVEGEDCVEEFLNQDYLPPSNAFEFISLKAESTVKLARTLGNTIKSLSLRDCEFSSSSELRSLVFKLTPNLVSLRIQLKIEPFIVRNQTRVKQQQQHYQQRGFLEQFFRYRRLLPMSLGQEQASLPKLRELELIGDFSCHTDIIFDVLRNAKNLEKIVGRKNCGQEDDLFGTWFNQVILSLYFQRLKYLELTSPLIQSQVELLRRQKCPLQMTVLNITQDVPVRKILMTVRHFRKTLKSVELGLENVPDSLVTEILTKFRNTNLWIAVHSKFDTKLVFPAQAYVVREDRV